MPASRTPEGFPSRCVVCGRATEIEFSATGGDAPCPHCGSLLRRSDMLAQRLRDQIAAALGVSPDRLTADFDLRSLGSDSLDMVELVMELEETLTDLELEIPDKEKENCHTFGELVQLILKYANRT